MTVDFHIEHESNEPTHCPYCQTEILAEDTLVHCSKCNATYHVSCWNEGDQCAMYGCDSEFAVAVTDQADGAAQNGTPQANFEGVPDFSIDITELTPLPQFSISESELAPALSCSYCHLEIGVGETSVVCMKCHATHHHDCWRERNRCAIYGCNHRVCSAPISTSQDATLYVPGTSTNDERRHRDIEVKTSWYRRAFDYVVDLFTVDRRDDGFY